MPQPNQIAIGPIGGSEGGMTLVAFKALLERADPAKPLELTIHSEGGEVFEGFGMYTALAEWPGKKIAKIKSAAFSIASYLAMACDEIEMADNGYLMIHNPYSRTEGDDEDHARGASTLSQLKESMVSAYASRTGLPDDEIKAMMKAETYINAADAVALKFADRVIASVKKARVFSPTNKLPQLVYASLFGDGGRGTQKESKRMSDTITPATVTEIKAAFPKAKADFIVKCLERSLPLGSVAAAAAEELMQENAMLEEKCKAMEEELAALKAKAMETDEEATAKAQEEEQNRQEEEMAKAKAKAKGVAPIAKASTPPSATKRPDVEWNEIVDSYIAKGMTRVQAAKKANRTHGELREAMVAAANQ